MIATFKEQTEAVLWLPHLKNKPRLCYDCHIYRANRGCAMIATFNDQTEAALWLPPSKNKPRLCYDCHL